jgi:hypothetical protein
MKVVFLKTKNKNRKMGAVKNVVIEEMAVKKTIWRFLLEH